MAKVKTITHEFDADTSTLSFIVVGGGEFDVDVKSLSEEIRNELVLHGLTQKISDAAAISKDTLTGDAKKDGKLKMERMIAVRDRLLAGNWTKPAEAGSGVSGIIFRSYSEWARASFEAAKKPVPSDETLRAKYEAMSRSEKLALKSVPAIAEIMNRLRAEKAPSVDADALLAELAA